MPLVPGGTRGANDWTAVWATAPRSLGAVLVPGDTVRNSVSSSSSVLALGIGVVRIAVLLTDVVHGNKPLHSLREGHHALHVRVDPARIRTEGTWTTESRQLAPMRFSRSKPLELLLGERSPAPRSSLAQGGPSR